MFDLLPQLRVAPLYIALAQGFAVRLGFYRVWPTRDAAFLDPRVGGYPHGPGFAAAIVVCGLTLYVAGVRAGYQDLSYLSTVGALVHVPPLFRPVPRDYAVTAPR